MDLESAINVSFIHSFISGLGRVPSTWTAPLKLILFK